MRESLSSRLLKVAGVVGPLVVIVVVLFHSFYFYPLRVFDRDVTTAKRIVLRFREPNDSGVSQQDAFELRGDECEGFSQTLRQTTELDYLRMQATAPPGVVVKLYDKDNIFVGQYAIRQGRGVGSCPAWISLRKKAKHGRQLSQEELRTEFDDGTLTKWPRFLPFRYDYTLPIARK